MGHQKATAQVTRCYLDSISSAHSDNGGQLARSFVIYSLVEVAAEQNEGDCDAHHQAAHLGCWRDNWYHNCVFGLWPNLRRQHDLAVNNVRGVAV